MTSPTRCISCPTLHTRPGRSGKPARRCDACAKLATEVAKARQQRIREQGLAEGLCVKCAGERDRPEVLLCGHCRKVVSNAKSLCRRRKTRKTRRRVQRKQGLNQRELLARQFADNILRDLTAMQHPPASVT